MAQNILSIDTSLEACSVSVAKGDDIHTIYEPMGRGQTERLLPMIVEACEAAEVCLDQMDAVAVTRGPGSFTGVRVGLSVARTLSTIRDIPLYGVSCFQALTGLMDPNIKTYALVIESKRNELYFQPVFDGIAQTPLLLTRDQLDSGFADLPLFGNIEGATPLPLNMLTQNMIEQVRDGQIEQGNEKPLYLRNADISKSKKVYRTLSSDVVTNL